MLLTVHTPEIRETLATLARTAATAGDEANANALNQAAYQVNKGMLAHVAVDALGDLLIPSKGESGTIYRVGELPCTCAAGRKGKPCWHAALYEAVQTVVADLSDLAESVEIVPAPALAARIAEITAAVHAPDLTPPDADDGWEDAVVAATEDTWQRYRQAVARGENASWAPEWLEEIYRNR